MTKKRILLINKSFELGGIQMALANLLNDISDEYDISLAIFNPRGPFLEHIPSNVRILKLSPFTEILGMSWTDCKEFGSFSQKILKIVTSVWSKLFGNKLPVAFLLAFQKNLGEYDVVISYHQETSAKTMVTGFGEFALKKCKAPKKIAWIHADFLATKLATSSNYRIYQKFDKIVSVSRTAMDTFIAVYPSLKDKCDFCYNSLPVSEIVNKSKLDADVFKKAKEDFVLFSACRLVPEKGLLPALMNLLPVFKSHQNLKWFIAGAGSEGTKLQSYICENNLQNQVVLLGFIKNPYPYINNANYLFLPSLHESFGMVVGEAHVLGTSVIASDIPIMREVLTQFDFLCKNNDYAAVISALLDTNNGMVSKNVFPILDWKGKFERILE